MAAYTVVREMGRRFSAYQVVTSPSGAAVKHFEDSQAQEAEALRDLLNTAYAEGQRSCAGGRVAIPASTFMGNPHY